MDIRKQILWLDCAAAFCAGILVLSLINWLQALHNLPRDLLAFIGITNLSYGAYSLTLAVLKQRTKALILILVIANTVWAANCLRLVISYGDTVSIFGIVHLIGEAIFVGTLAFFEWRWRKILLMNSGDSA